MAKVLNVMRQVTRPRSGRAIAHSCQGVSVSQVNIALRKLEAIGVVVSDPAPPSKLYQINHDHVLTGSLMKLLGAKSDLMSWLSAQLVELPGLISATVFGSVARGEDGEESDLDLLLVFSDDTDLGLRVGRELDLQSDFLLKSGTSLGIISKSLSEVLASLEEESAFMQNVLSEGNLLFGEGLASLTKRKRFETPGSKVSRAVS